MRWILAVFCIVPLVATGQSKYSSAGKRLFRQATDAFNAGDIDEAIGYFEDCVAEDPNFAEAHLNLSAIHYSQSDFSGALESARSAYKYNRYQPEIYVSLGKAFYQNRMYDSASVVLSRAVSEFGNKSEDVYLHLAKSLTRTGENTQAIEYLNLILESSPNNAAALNERGTAYFNEGDFENATIDLNSALLAAPGNATIYTNLASLAIEMGDSALAESSIQKALETATKTEKVQVLILQGNIQFSGGNHDAASEIFDEAFLLDNENEAVLVNQSSILLEKEEYQLAWEKCNQALDLNNQSMQAYFNRGIANEMLRRTDDACLDWEQAFVLGSEKAEEFLNSPACAE